MSEDRTQPPSKRRRQLAREQGQAAHSPELTAAAGWLAAVVVLWFCGGGLASGLVGPDARLAVGVGPGGDAGRPGGAGGSGPRHGPGAGVAARRDPGGVRGRRGGRPPVAGAGPLGEPADRARPGSALDARARPGAGGAVRARRLGGGEGGRAPGRPGLGDPGRLGGGPRAWDRSRGPSWRRRRAGPCSAWRRVLAGVLAVLGLADYGLCYCRFESMLRTTPEEQREDQRVLEGDVTARAQRRRIARAWRGDSPELLAGASLVLHGTGGLTVILSGGPPPRRVLIRGRRPDGRRAPPPPLRRGGEDPSRRGRRARPATGPAPRRGPRPSPPSASPSSPRSGRPGPRAERLRRAGRPFDAAARLNGASGPGAVATRPPARVHGPRPSRGPGPRPRAWASADARAWASVSARWVWVRAWAFAHGPGPRRDGPRPGLRCGRGPPPYSRRSPGWSAGSINTTRSPPVSGLTFTPSHRPTGSSQARPRSSRATGL